MTLWDSATEVVKKESLSVARKKQPKFANLPAFSMETAFHFTNCLQATHQTFNCTRE